MRILIILGIAVLLYLGEVILYRTYWRYRLTAQIAFSTPYVNVGETLAIKETIRNEKRLPISCLRVKLKTSNTFVFEDQSNAQITDHYYRNDVFTLLPYQQIVRSYSFETTKRGYYTIRHIDMIGSDLFLRHTYVWQSANETSLYVYPTALAQQDIPTDLIRWIGNQNQEHSLVDDPFLFRGVRAYQPGDPMSKINWKLVAKTQELYTNVTDGILQQEVLILCNFHPFYENSKDHLMEYVIRILTTLLEHYVGMRTCVHLYTNGIDLLSKDTMHMDAIKDMADVIVAKQALARINLKEDPAEFSQIARSAASRHDHVDTMIMVCNDRNDGIQDLFSELSRQYQTTRFILPEFGSVPIHQFIPNSIVWEVPYE